MKRIYILLAFLLYASIGLSQSYSYGQYITDARKHMAMKNYQTALERYAQALEFGRDDISVLYEYAECARLYNAYSLAAEKYQQVIDSESDNEYPMASFWLADVNQQMGNYDKAKQLYEMYLAEQDGEDAYYSQKADKELKAIEWAREIVANQEDHIQVTHLGEDVNSVYNDFAPVFENGNLIYSSLRFDYENTSSLPAKQYAKVLSSPDGVSSDYDENLNVEDIVTSHTAFNTNKSRFYYTICDYITASELRCDIYYRPVLGDGTLGNAVKLGDEINNTGSTNTQPAIGYNENLGKEVLYFVSDRSGGQGKLDIWYATIEGDNQFGSVSNLSSVNTAEDDITPFFHNGSQVLYFSSDGYQSLGGFDIYRSNLGDGGFETPDHLGAPTNSSYHDVYYHLSDDSKTAHFASNREGSMYLNSDLEACCLDIYRADIGDVKLNLNALTFDRSNNTALNGATVRLICVKSGDEMGVITNIESNDHVFDLVSGKEYKIVVEHPDYLPSDPIFFSTLRSFKSEEIIKKLYLEKAPNPYQLQVLTFDQLSSLSLNGCTVTLTNLTDGSVQQVTLTNSASNDFSFQVIQGHSYRLEASKSGYYGSSLSFVADYANGETLLIKRLYLRPSIPNLYLPLVLYFDNDHPNPRSRSLETNMTYTQTYNNYIVLKNKYKEEYSKTLSGSNKSLAESRVEAFFEDKFRPGRYRNGVREGYSRLQLFLNTLSAELAKGTNYTIEIRGYASPRAATKYNMALSQRRVESLKNELRSYAGGVLIPYLNDGSLTIKELAYGEVTSASDVSDALYDLRNSWYSPEASQERRVEIERIITN